MKNQLIKFFALSLLLIPTIVCASDGIEIKIDIKPSFTLNEEVIYNYSIVSDNNINITYVASIICPKAPIPLLQYKMVELKANTSFQEVYSGILIDDNIESQKCKAYVKIETPFELKKEKEFTINTAPTFVFDLNICKDQACIEKSKIFVQDENIYLDYTSEVSEPIITVTLTLPNKTQQQMILPSIIEADQIGTYTLKVKAEKEGYLPTEKTVQFGVIESAVRIRTFGEIEFDYNTLITIIIVIAVLTSIVVFLYYRRAKKEIDKFKQLKEKWRRK